MSDIAAIARVSIGAELFSARFRYDLAPHTCALLQKLLPYTGEVIHARWSGDAIWSPLSGAWPAGLRLPAERATGSPAPGDILLYAGEQSEPELLIAYGPSRFACRSGPLRGNPVLAIDDRPSRLAELGHRVLHQGAMKLRLGFITPLNEATAGSPHNPF